MYGVGRHAWKEVMVVNKQSVSVDIIFWRLRQCSRDVSSLVKTRGEYVIW